MHAAPYDAPARGKQARFWRTLREQCLDLIEGAGLDALHAVNTYALRTPIIEPVLFPIIQVAR